MTRSDLITCIFCGEQKKSSDEHVISTWVRERLNIASPVTTLVRPSGLQHVDPILTVKLRRTVCKDCNSGWMSQLEMKVRPYLGPILVHEGSVDLDAEQQRDLARWAVMKTLLFELALRQQHPHRRPGHGYAPSQPELAWLYVEDEPPPRSRVWLGAFDAKNRLPASTRSALIEAPINSDKDTLSAHRTTVTLGYVLLQVFSIDFVTADKAELSEFNGTPPEPIDEALTGIWPVSQPVVHWPSGYCASEDSIDRVVMWT